MRPAPFRDRRVRLSGKAFLTRRLYFFADYVDGRIFALKYEGGKINECRRRVYAADRRAAKGLIGEESAAVIVGEDADGGVVRSAM